MWRCRLPNGPDALIAFYAINYIGAVFVPFNTAYRGALLEHVIANSGARFLLVHPDLAPRLEGLSLGAAERLILTGPSETLTLPVQIEEASALDGDPAACSASPSSPTTRRSIIFTSGTTGPSKAVVTSYVQEWTTAKVTYGYMVQSDRMLVNLPMFHVGGIAAITAAVACGGSVALFEAFDTRRFWDTVRETGYGVHCGLIGADLLPDEGAAQARRRRQPPAHGDPVADRQGRPR